MKIFFYCGPLSKDIFSVLSVLGRLTEQRFFPFQSHTSHAFYRFGVYLFHILIVPGGYTYTYFYTNRTKNNKQYIGF